MATILNIETATSVCSAAISKNGKILALKESDESNVHAEKLLVFIEECLAKSKMTLKKVDAIAIGSGPGSYTGLRIGTSTAKGLCYGLGKPLIAVSTLKAMANAVSGLPKSLQIEGLQNSDNVLFCPMIDARRMEIYTALYNKDGKEIMPVHARVLDENSFSEYLDKNIIAFCGDGALKAKKVKSANKNAVWIENIKASAANLATLAEEAFNKSAFADLAYYEPFYLKVFVAKKSS